MYKLCSRFPWYANQESKEKEKRVDFNISHIKRGGCDLSTVEEDETYN